MSDYEVSRRVTTSAVRDVVTALVDDFHQWPAWSPWEGLDEHLQRTYSGPDRGTGAAYAWTGNRRAGAGRMAITGQAPDRIEVDVQFNRPVRSHAAITFHLTELGRGTEIVWRMTGRRAGALRVMGVIGGMDRKVGPDFERGLSRLSQVAEERSGAA